MDCFGNNKWFLYVFLLSSGLYVIGANTRFVSEGDAMQLNCPYNRVNSWQSGTNDILVVCEGRKPMINTNLSISNRINISNNCTMLTVINFTKGDAGTYACFITQKGINESDIYGKHEIHVKLRQITIIEAKGNLVINRNEGDHVNLTCTVQGPKQDDKLFWISENSVQPAEGTNGSIIKSFVAQRSDNMKEFICVANNSVNTLPLKASVRLNLLLKPRVKIISSPSQVTTIGQRITLTCRDEYEKTEINDEILWIHNGLHLPNKTRILFFDKANRSIAGQYACVVENAAGRDSAFINITVNCKPEMPSNVQIIALDHKIIVKWQTGYKGRLQQTLFLEYKKHFELGWKSVAIENKTSTTIEGLQMDTVYVVRMFSKNYVGESNKTREIIVKTGKYHSKITDGSWKTSIITGVTVAVFLVVLSGIQALTRRYCLQITSERSSQPQRNDTLERHGALYDEIESVYYNPATGSSRIDATVGNRPKDIRLSTPNNGRQLENSETGSFVNENLNDELASDEIKPSRSSEHVSSASSSEESYLVPSRKYINLEIFGTGEQNEHEREQENHVEGSSVSSSEGSETHIKTDQKYETLETTRMVVHTYESIVDTL